MTHFDKMIKENTSCTLLFAGGEPAYIGLRIEIMDASNTIELTLNIEDFDIDIHDVDGKIKPTQRHIKKMINRLQKLHDDLAS
jgi:hypothetical protein